MLKDIILLIVNGFVLVIIEELVEYCIEPYLLLQFTVHHVGLGSSLSCNL